MTSFIKLPPGWSIKNLKEIGKCLNGLTYSPEDLTDESGMLVLRSSNVQGGKIVLGDNVYVKTQLKIKNITHVGDILICVRNGSRGLIGKNALIKKQGAGCAHGAFMMIFRSHSSSYLYHLFNSSMYRKQVHRNLGATINSINSSDFYKFTFPFPPANEQKVITKLLSTWDDAIEKTEELILAKRKVYKQTAKQLLFGHQRINQGQVDFVDGHFFQYPSDWQLVKIEDIAKEVSEKNRDPLATVLSCSKYDGFVNSLDYFGKKVFSDDTSNYKVIQKGQFGYPANHIEEGSIGLLDHCEKGIVSPIYVVFKTSAEKVHQPYLYKVLKTSIYRHIFEVSTSSSVDRRGSLRWKEFSKIRVPLPSLEEQQQIADVIANAEREITLLEQLADKYKTQKRGLMQKLLTGEWRVNHGTEAA